MAEQRVQASCRRFPTQVFRREAAERRPNVPIRQDAASTRSTGRRRVHPALAPASWSWAGARWRSSWSNRGGSGRGARFRRRRGDSRRCREALVGAVDGDEVGLRDGPEMDRRAMGEPAHRRVEGGRDARDVETSVRRAGAVGRRRAEVEVGQDGSAVGIRRSVQHRIRVGDVGGGESRHVGRRECLGEEVLGARAARGVEDERRPDRAALAARAVGVGRVGRAAGRDRGAGRVRDVWAEGRVAMPVGVSSLKAGALAHPSKWPTKVTSAPDTFRARRCRGRSRRT